MSHVQLLISVDESLPHATQEVLSSDLNKNLAMIRDLQVSAPENSTDEYRERITGLEILATFLASSAFLVFAKAVRDHVKKKRITIKLKRADKTELLIEASGSDEEAIAKIVDFASGK
jgi:hypothetical protein